ncbi:hypothetical protein WICPIJ_003396 [Wickerhamomyces pijperi]|uniref:Eukaryotic translation initiation factor 4E n=1 Tax=Wickerhamomyces pijperi TaxID=599730 RepID=A0A9P8QA13_WICPI|nr:hypothetical protein WICPIJ_003396 [Wickerhamomyces pijperi]
MSEELNQATKDLTLEEQPQQPQQSAEQPLPEAELKHPLNSKWTLWYTKPSNGKEAWSDLLKPIISFSSVEEFWGIFNSVPAPSELPLKGDYHLFRDDIKPEWEDIRNSEGGRWSFEFKSKNNVDINELWLRGLMSVIGETIQDDEDEVNGIVLNNRKFAYRVSLWTKTTSKSKLTAIGERFKKVLKLTDDDSIEFYVHKGSDQRDAKPILMF